MSRVRPDRQGARPAGSLTRITGPGHITVHGSERSPHPWASALRDGGVEIEREMTWEEGRWSIYVRDPAGNSVELIEGEAWRRP